MSTPAINQAALAEAVRATIDRVVDGETAAVAKAADILYAALQAGGIVQAFGTGHSEALTKEIAGRAGGLVPTNRISLRDVVLRGGEPLSVLDDPMFERDPQVAHRLYELASPHPADAFVIASNSGINGSIVEMALLVKERGHPLIALTSMQHTRQMASRHPSGRRLAELADVVLDNGAPYGDAILPLPGGGAACAVSTITSALLAQLVLAEVVRRYLDAGQQPPIYLSANIEGGDEHNRALEARYAGRIHRGAG
ncbi:MAG: SIS domain-containing protein [Micromonosporaceae bacterium]|jgi:uncharacterized phosphosugar-binding protein|nr:SIS domain-containing protein [Micromonosporaceae bacterium]